MCIFDARDFVVLHLLRIIILSATLSLLTFTSGSTASSSENRYSLKGLNSESYAELGDINIGAFLSVTTYPVGFICSKVIRTEMYILQYMEAIAFAVRLINDDQTLLPNITLGFVMLDYCRTPNTALAQALSFLPIDVVETDSTTCGVPTPGPSDDNPTLVARSNFTSLQETTLGSTVSSNSVSQYDVVGVLGPQGSTSTVPVSILFSVAQIPIVSYMATSDELSSPLLHPYFLRVVPPDKHQVVAMLTFITEKGWSYISVIYGDNSYGDRAYYNIRQLSPEYGICIATAHSVDLKTNFNDILDNLLRYKNARVVILFIETDATLKLMAACDQAGVKNHFIWIGSDSISDKTLVRGQYWDYLHGAFTFMYYSQRVSQFETYFSKLRPGQTTNPWFDAYWEYQTGCQFAEGNCLLQRSIQNFEELKVSSSVSLVIDSVFTFGFAIHKLLNDICPSIVGQEARVCIKGDQLLSYMLNLTFQGFTGKIAFDANGDLIGKYEIRQMSYDNESLADTDTDRRGNLLEIPIAYFESKSGTITYTDRPIFWKHLSLPSSATQLPSEETNDVIPESLCSKPCAVGEFKIQKELPCCWECRKCRDNERLANKNTSCAACFKFTWPDPKTNFTTCTPIPLTSTSISDTFSIIVVCIAVVAIVSQGLTVVTYLYYREHRVIKAASRELSILQMVAIFVGYVTVILLQMTPTNSVCAVIYFMFCLSFTWLYSPMIVKAVRIYRIFSNSSKSNRRPRFVSPQSQLVMAGLLIVVQVCLCVATYVLYRPAAKLTQPIQVEKFVELSCDMTLPGLASFLTYNLFLVSLCSVLAFKTRKLPDNFNESRFTSMCVSTTMVIWLAFVPTYFTASREHIRVLLLSAALLINHSVALVFLFCPKLYAAVYVTSDTVAVSRFHTNNGSSMTTQIPVVSNRVAPANVDS
ncbi:unnamed protein product [Candidula unifasciata]|uniref:G-protein coupled receptors family 3 profile domain-containing protein n=1 Tax=Candidula unifasciata TaxID=100452 RepID=A0A8S3ZAK4_9EUPU|nr:unnamed protein product [Candidula unifasciata]